MRILSKAAWLGALTLLFCLFGSPTQAANQSAHGYCEQGAVIPTVSNLPTNISVQASYPGCTVTVYLTGTLTLATIYSDVSNTPLGNPFTASVTTGYWNFYAANACYDVTISGGGPPGLSAPFTYGDICLGGGSGGGSPGSPDLSLQYNKEGMFGGSGYLDYEAPNACPDTSSTTCIVAMDTGGGDTVALGTNSISIYGPSDISANGASLLNVEGLQVYETSPPPFTSYAYPECAYEAVTFFCMNMNGSTTITASGTTGVLEIGNTNDTAGAIFIGDGASTTCTISTSINTCPGGGSAGGSDTQIQFNNMGGFSGSANFIWDYGTNNLAITGTESISGQLTSTLTTGTAPFVIASTTNVPNLNASSLSGATFAAPGPIGSGTASTGAFTTLSASSTVSGTGFSTYLASPPAIGGTAPAAVSMTVGTFTSQACIEGTAPSAVSGKDIVYCDSTAHATYISANGGGFAQVRTGTVGVAVGGTSLTTITLGDLLCGNGTGTPILVPPVMSGYVLTDNGAGACPTFQVGPTGMSSSLDTVTAAMADATIGNGAYQERWNSTQAGNKTAFYLGEASAATSTGNIKLRVSTLNTSTAEPFRFDNNGNGIVMNDLGVVESIGTGGNDFQGSIVNFPAACSAAFVRAIAAAPTCNQVSMTADITGVTPFANGGTNNNAAPVKRVLFRMAGCNAGVSAPSLDIPNSGGMGNNCKTDGTHGTVMGILSAAAGSIAYISIPIPHDFVSFNSAQMMFTTSDVTNGHTIIFNIATACTQPDNNLTDTPAYNAANAFATKTIGGGAVANALYSTSAGTITGTGCAADYMLHIAFSRSGSDTSTDTAIAIESLIVDYNGGFG